MFPQVIDTAGFVGGLGWAVVHGLWQQSIIGLAISLLLLQVDPRRASLRYRLCAVALGIMALQLLVTAFFLAVPLWRPEADLRFEKTWLDTLASAGADRAGSRPGPEGRFASTARSFAQLAGGTWLILSAALLIRVGGGVLHLGRLVRHGSALEAQRRDAEPLAHRLGLKRPFAVMGSALVEVPAVIGHRRPVIVFPLLALGGMNAAEVNAILAHELAHIRRGDYIANVVQACVEALLFYSPVARWISDRMRIEREFCCDDVAVAATGTPQLYAQSLVRLERYRFPAGTLAPAAGGRLPERIRRIAEHHGKARPRTVVQKRRVTVVLAGLAALLAGFAGQATAISTVADSQRSVGFWLAASTDANPRVRFRAARALGEYDDSQAVGRLIRVLERDTNTWVRDMAITSLGRLRCTCALDPLMRVLDDPNPYLRHNAISALAQIRAAGARPALVAALRDGNPYVRAAAVHALALQ